MWSVSRRYVGTLALSLVYLTAVGLNLVQQLIESRIVFEHPSPLEPGMLRLAGLDRHDLSLRKPCIQRRLQIRQRLIPRFPHGHTVGKRERSGPIVVLFDPLQENSVGHSRSPLGLYHAPHHQ